jgi:hypothetical protein
MKRKTNSVQENYILAKAMWEAVHKIQVEKYNDFLTLKGISDEDINDDDFDVFNSEYEVYAKTEIDNSTTAWESYKLAEKALIEFGISLIPEELREKAANGVNWYLQHKLKLIELVMSLDVSTLPITKQEAAA